MMEIVSDRECAAPPADMSVIERLQSLRLRSEDGAAAQAPSRIGWSGWAVAAMVAVGALVTASGFVLFAPQRQPAAAAAAAAKAPPAQPGTAPGIVASGYVVARRRATIASEVTGRLVKLTVEEGQRVERGQLLAELDGVIADAALANSVAAQRALTADLAGRAALRAEAARDLARTQELADRGFATTAVLTAKQAAYQLADSNFNASQATLAAARASTASARSMVGQYRIVAPFAGVVVSTNAQVGEIISPISAGGGFTRTGICTIVDMTSLEVEVAVNEALIGRVRPGQPVTVVLDAYQDLNIPGRVVAIIPTADRERSSIRVRIGLLAADARILPDMAVKVNFAKVGKDNI